MSLAAGMYNLNITVVREGASTEFGSIDAVIDNELTVHIGTVNNYQTVYGLGSSVGSSVQLGSINHYQTVYTIGSSVESVTQLGRINHVQTVRSVAASVGTLTEVTLPKLSQIQTVYAVSATFTSNIPVTLGSIAHIHTLYPITGDTGMAQIQSTTPYIMGEPFTITTTGTDLTTLSSLSLTIDGLDHGAASNITSNTATFTALSEGIKPKAQYDLILGVK